MRGRNPFDGKPQLTLRDVAEAAGVSEMTVSRVLRNRGDVSERTRVRVFEAARTLGYVPNKIAGALASNRVNLVGVVIPSLSNMVFPDVLSGIGDVLDETPLQPVIGTSQYNPETEEKVIYEMLSWRPSGLIVAGLEHSTAARAMMRSAGIPVVEVMDIDGAPVAAAVGISHVKAGREMAREIIARGYRRIGYLGSGSGGDHRAQKRLQGFRKGLEDAGIELVERCFYEGTSGFGTGRAMTAEVLTRIPDLDFLYYNTDMNAAGGLLYCLEKGMKIPDDIGLAGFNSFEVLDGLPMRIATMDSRRKEIGARAAELIAANALTDEVIELDPEFLPGDTVRPAS
ncbi:LacI family DNA-binding transcriptional regulator [Roseobacter sp. HKCCD9010]|uniref:LacI family DNA-binding transcriptional regulator n=1 Tax=unclassified Roseobacter TaxID=196798 RepID=UPI0014928E54|nr:MULTISPECIES: LacI family DNA-binding transcriptional regulator [unclassified Roseobacter]MBF9048546.1 LacI family DNA-binding transcriptional regulator [Rhodobacterales bacterium HKCCD4356]NNV10545.1 LacI family DNA-binding transcriptional regulator [Roseobacter sp. HKCCD7357]NNV14730.1 LacI family DNA-binding transcriptional regulator [Roseobacter sp. HKCCD8768]NNV24189.1 LacI family DNA-binding transcriptional regulator [Roseobacter sp. HKCCD8192]NNV28446.1 LacI family DNA-binding transc